MSQAIPTGKELNSGNKTLVNPFGLGGQQSWLNPSDWKSGKLERGLTGDTSTDMRQGLARYGFHAAPWMPALAVESMKKGDKMKEQAAQDAIYQENLGRFNAAQPYQRDVQFQGNNPFLHGQYNQMANMLAKQASPAYAGVGGGAMDGPRFGIDPPQMPGQEMPGQAVANPRFGIEPPPMQGQPPLSREDEMRFRIMGGLL